MRRKLRININMQLYLTHVVLYCKQISDIFRTALNYVNVIVVVIHLDEHIQLCVLLVTVSTSILRGALIQFQHNHVVGLYRTR